MYMENAEHKSIIDLLTHWQITYWLMNSINKGPRYLHAMIFFIMPQCIRNSQDASGHNQDNKQKAIMH